MNRQTRESPFLLLVIGEAPSPAGSYFRPGHTAGYILDKTERSNMSRIVDTINMKMFTDDD